MTVTNANNVRMTGGVFLSGECERGECRRCAGDGCEHGCHVSAGPEVRWNIGCVDCPWDGGRGLTEESARIATRAHEVENNHVTWAEWVA